MVSYGEAYDQALEIVKSLFWYLVVAEAAFWAGVAIYAYTKRKKISEVLGRLRRRLRL